MNEFDTLGEVAIKIKSDLDGTPNKNRFVLLYAFNSSGKTRMSTLIANDSENKSLSYDAFFEDLFIWDNENYILKFEKSSKYIVFIKDQFLENQITDNFQSLTGSKIQPSYDFEKGEITFNFTPGDDRSENNIKISRGEETIFVWSIFFTFLESVLSILTEEPGNRETNDFNNLEYIIIDDPVSSLDDTKIISMTVELVNMINACLKNNLKVFVTTHHALFYNVLFNEFRYKKLQTSWVLSKNSTNFRLEKQDDSPFGYHLLVMNKIQEAIASNSLEKYHFNLFRSLLEKSANFLGYSSWKECLTSSRRLEMIDLVNQYSHGRLSELESKHFPDEHKDLFIATFNEFFLEFKWKK